ncbi:DUF262 domain-containing protein [Fluviispira multicolorata]|uniref:DUF262 domain-containing protein n=1 Tax=Fluviispira multicolorata TaxID=2654512 RepID=A0A833N4R1_9BACT|nr:DUF262 domain-containing protein [Fluviispira multicolorata]KAB8033127.1 DUF262 domain-containing protein [Fluviispira multicolorata]
MQTINFNLNELKTKINSNNFRIPQFQRNFVWKEIDTRKLIDSIARNYPIGSQLILEVDKESQFDSRSLDFYTKKDENNNEYLEDNIDLQNQGKVSGSYLVLDGQQRLTSIARVFNDANEKKVYYFDLKKMYEIFIKGINSYEYDWILSLGPLSR